MAANDSTSSLSMSTTHIVSLLQWRREQTRQHDYDPTSSLSMSTTHIVSLLPNGIHHIQILITYLPTKPYESTRRWNGGWILDGKSMGDTGQIYSEAPRPGCQKVLEVNTCVGFSSILSKDYGKKTKQGEELGESCWHAGKMWPISSGSLKDMAGMDGTVKTSMRSGNTATPRQIFSSQGLQGLWMFGDTGQAMGVHLRSTSHGGHGY
ncbi:hypothetical protein HO173_011309 [Letharia columbiana]|uniref:Uncharacterized protein n=1 Tax=Letharia columbiana TaxID=112416 RepID=A0A8H6KZ83_9LECA|nr:uncharacterized protein HO173_011309 [Letharia columbiana]KAF6229663.1 hypothetical protein HO173_011309 [Letharia columbiana]